MMKPTRREFASTIAGGLALTLSSSAAEERPNRLTARPRKQGIPTPAAPGLHKLGLRNDRDALLYIPESARARESAPLVVSLHGATRDADRGISLLQAWADEHGFVLLAPASEEGTWDAIRGSWGPDVEFINRSLARTFELIKIDPARIAMAGFSDGASYSLSIGLSNGDLFHAVLGLSPGFVIREQHVGKPPVFISHGTIDPILPIDQCSRLIVPMLKNEGYTVTYREFEGKHTLPPEVGTEAMQWLLKASGLKL
jgi:phospholipase/carboxylesterase